MLRGPRVSLASLLVVVLVDFPSTSARAAAGPEEPSQGTRAFGARGSLVFVAGVGLGSYQAVGSGFGALDNVSVAPALDVFIARHVSWGLSIPLSCTAGLGAPWSASVGVAPRIGYVFPLAELLLLWPRVSIGFTSAWQEAEAPTGPGTSSNAFFQQRILSTTLYAPVHTLALPHTALGVGPFASFDLLDRADSGAHPRKTTVGMQIEIVGWR